MATSTSAPPTLGRTDTHLRGDGAMWVMVLGDLAIFGAYFIVYICLLYTSRCV